MQIVKTIFLILLSVVNWIPASVWEVHNHDQAPVCIVSEHHHNRIDQGCNLSIRFGHTIQDGCSHKAHISHYKNSCEICSQHWLVAFFEQTSQTHCVSSFVLPRYQTQNEQTLVQHLFNQTLRGPPKFI